MTYFFKKRQNRKYYEKWEKGSKRIRKENEALLKEFEFWLSKSGLGNKTIKNHSENVDFYINSYLLYSDIIEAKAAII